MLRRAALAAVLVAGFVVGGQVAATAGPPVCTAWGDINPTQPGLQYGCTQYTGGGTGDGGDDGGSGGNATPACTFHGVWNDFCQGTRACYLNDPAAVQDIEKAREDTPGLSDKPDDADHLIFTSCLRAGEPLDNEIRTYYWDSEFDGPSLEDQLLAAYGQLDLPTIQATFNPPTRTLVNLDTWWWAEGAPEGTIVGSEALGMVAIADPRSMVVSVTGPRTDSVSCPLVTGRADTCTMIFRRSGVYEATMTLTYDVRFELNGQPIDIPTGAEDLTSISTTSEVTVPVYEVQTRVTKPR